MQNNSAGQSNAPERGKVEYFSFWKPDPVPPKNAKILPVALHSLGKLADVTEKLFDVPGMARVPKSPWEVAEENPALRLKWEVDEGVILHVRTEQGPPKPGEVLTIGAASSAPQRVFYRLYVQIYEQFGVTVFDERLHDFYTPREFRSKMAG